MKCEACGVDGNVRLHAIVPPPSHYLDVIGPMPQAANRSALLSAMLYNMAQEMTMHEPDDRTFLRELRRAALQLVAVIDKHYPTEETKRKALTQTQTK